MVKKKTSGFKYQGRSRSVESVSRKSKQTSSSFDSYVDSSIPMLKVREGETQLRILPPTWSLDFREALAEDEKAAREEFPEEAEVYDRFGDGWEIQIFLHRDVGADGGTYLCRNKLLGEHCPICEARRDSADEEEQQALRANWKALAWVIDRDNERAGPQIWAIPVTLFREINARSIDKHSGEVVLIDDPEEGYDIIFDRQGTDKRTKYSGVEVLRESSPIHENPDKQDAWLDYITEHPLPSVLQFYDADYIEKMLWGQAAADRDDDAVPRRRARRNEEEDDDTRSSGRRRRSSSLLPEDEEEDEGDVRRRSSRRRSSRSEDAEDEEEAPRRRSSSRRRSSTDDEEEDDSSSSSRRRSSTRRSSRSRDPDEEESEEPDAEEVEEDDDDNPLSSRRRGSSGRRGRAKAEEPEEDEPEEPEEDEPEEETPSRGARRSLGKLRGRSRK